MNSNPRHNPALLEPREAPKIQQLIDEIGRSLTSSTRAAAAMELADDVRHCYWTGQSTDGRKHAADLRKAPFPWEGASDARVRVAEELINEQVLVLLTSLYRAKAQVVPREMGDVDSSRLLGLVLNYYLGTLMRSEIRDEMSLVADWRQTYGFAVLHVGWHEETRLVARTLSRSDLLERAMLSGQEASAAVIEDAKAQIADVVDPDQAYALSSAAADKAETIEKQYVEKVLAMMNDRALRQQLAVQVAAYDPDILPDEVSRVADALQESDEPVEYYASDVVESRPCWEALLPMVDVFFPPETRKLQDARWIARARWLTEQQVRAEAAAEGWDEKWTERVLQNPGAAFSMLDTHRWVMGTHGVRWEIPLHERTHLYQIVEVHYKAVTKGGITGVYRTLVHQCWPDGYGLHELQEAAHGQYPFVEFRRERTQRLLLSSRGVAEVVATDQLAVKTQHDARTDLTALSIRPPLIKPMNLAGGRVQDDVSPGGEVWERRAGTLRWMDPPRGDAAGKSVEIEGATWTRLARRFGRMDAEMPPALTQMHLEGLVSDWFTDVVAALRLTVQLVQQYMPDMEGIRVLGGEEAFAAAGGPQILNATADDIQGSYDFDLHFDPRELDLEWLMKKLSLLTDIAIPLDSQAVVDRAAIVRMILSSIDPRIAQAASTGEEAALSEEQDELTQLAIIMAGEEPVMQLGQDHALRLQVLQRALQRSPMIQAAANSNKQVAAVLEARMKHHQQQIDQEENKVIGRMGARQVLGGAA